jgi:hypothetical protein
MDKEIENGNIRVQFENFSHSAVQYAKAESIY